MKKDSRICELKHRISERERIPLKHYNLRFEGKILKEEETLLFYGIREFSSIEMHASIVYSIHIGCLSVVDMVMTDEAVLDFDTKTEVVGVKERSDCLWRSDTDDVLRRKSRPTEDSFSRKIWCFYQKGK
jgi:hypothetical protein